MLEGHLCNHVDFSPAGNLYMQSDGSQLFALKCGVSLHYIHDVICVLPLWRNSAWYHLAFGMYVKTQMGGWRTRLPNFTNLRECGEWLTFNFEKVLQKCQ